MYLMALDCSGTAMSVAVAKGPRFLGESCLHHDFRHSGHLLPCMEALLDQLALPIEQIQGMAVTVGPGSYTGIRMGIASMQALAYAVGAKLFGFSSLAIMAQGFDFLKAPLVTAIDARRGRTFSAIYQEGDALLEEANREAGALVEAMAALKIDKAYLLGDGSQAVMEAAATADVHVEPIHPEATALQARQMLPLLFEKMERGALPEVIQAAYLSPSQAERLAGEACR